MKAKDFKCMRIVFVGSGKHFYRRNFRGMRKRNIKIIGMPIRLAVKYTFMPIKGKPDEQTVLRASCRR